MISRIPTFCLESLLTETFSNNKNGDGILLFSVVNSNYGVLNLTLITVNYILNITKLLLSTFLCLHLKNWTKTQGHSTPQPSRKSHVGVFPIQNLNSEILAKKDVSFSFYSFVEGCTNPLLF